MVSPGKSVDSALIETWTQPQTSDSSLASSKPADVRAEEANLLDRPL